MHQGVRDKNKMVKEINVLTAEEQEQEDLIIQEIDALMGDKRMKAELESYLKFVFQ